MIEYRTCEKCDSSRCDSVNISETSFSEIHGHHYICNDCGYIWWGGRKSNEEKNKKRPPCPSAKDLKIDCCQICRLKTDNLGYAETLEVHHLDGDATNNDRLNLLVVCTCHHKLIHHQITYYNNHYMQR